jgi:hypothetical protein
MEPVPWARSRRYSGSDRPAWRMNHTGVRGTGRLRQANRNGASAGGAMRGDASAREALASDPVRPGQDDHDLPRPGGDGAVDHDDLHTAWSALDLHHGGHEAD